MASLRKVPFISGLRRMFYAVTPNETSFEFVEDVPIYTNEAVPFFTMFVLIEAVISMYKKDGISRLNDSITSMSAGMFSRLPSLVLRTITITSYVWVYEHYNLIELPWDSAWTWWLCFLGVDLGYYWFHRMAHEVNFMWAAHQVHHSSEDYNFSTALRQSVLQVYTSWVFYLPLALFIPPSVFLVHMELNILYQFWIHTQYIKSLGPLEYILNTPSHHRVHHGRNPYCIDKNYAGTLIIWDRLFGTFKAEREEVVYGLTHNINTFEPFNVQFGYIGYLLYRIYNTGGLLNKMGVLLCGPGWLPGKPRTGDIEDIPKVKAPVNRYGPHVNFWINIYVAIHFLVELYVYQEVLASKNGLSQTAVILSLTYIGMSLTCFGQILDGKLSGVYFEIVHCLGCIMCEIILHQSGFFGSLGEQSVSIYLLRIFFTLSASIWIWVLFKQQSSEKAKIR
ncbi:hypothetical protein CHS0354_005018 [Potamilus streckersoni]|uniref:Alkylglycerol monooxygenase n=1 Tax=Potamilus streckersoni TaxID=2493646 RepID=A0AAE0SSQ3_9BIVA|nr:hypothetical protein CHS0354_005018 [Potamilus streckersoni]